MFTVRLLLTFVTIPQDIANKWNEVKRLVPQRDRTLQDEMVKQQNNEHLRRQFASKANTIGPWIENNLDAIASIGVNMKSSLEDQLNKLRAYEKTTNAYKPNIDELEKINEVCCENESC